MDNGVDAMLADQLTDEILVGDVAPDQRGLGRHRPVKTCRQPVEHDDLLARIEQLPDHVAADVAGTARYQYRHDNTPHRIRRALCSPTIPANAR